MNRLPRGILSAVGAYLLWGVLPVYWKALQALPAPEILSHRIVWSLLLLAGVLAWRREGRSLLPVLSDPRALGLYLTAALLLAVNWLTYIYGVNSGQIVETSLGYYINPLISVVLGVAVLRERLSRVQWFAVGLAAAGVGYLTLRVGRLPWIALVLAVSFGLYGLAKKKAPLASLPGVTVETAALVAPALGYLLWLAWQGEGAMGHASVRTQLLLAFAGVATAIPLLLFAHAARQVPLSTIGLLQYMSPTCGLLLGVFVYGERFDANRFAGFGIIWLALALYWIDSAWGRRRPDRG